MNIDIEALAEILVETLPKEQVTLILNAISNRSHFGCCIICGEHDIPIDKSGNEVKEPDTSETMVAFWQERHSEECLVTHIEKRLD